MSSSSFVFSLKSLHLAKYHHQYSPYNRKIEVGEKSPSGPEQIFSIALCLLWKGRQSCISNHKRYDFDIFHGSMINPGYVDLFHWSCIPLCLLCKGRPSCISNHKRYDFDIFQESIINPWYVDLFHWSCILLCLLWKGRSGLSFCRPKSLGQPILRSKYKEIKKRESVK